MYRTLLARCEYHGNDTQYNSYPMRTNPVLTPCKQGAVHFSPRPYAQYRWATRPQARCGTLPYNHQIRYQKCKKCRPENKCILTFRVPISPIRPPTWPEKNPQKPVEISLRHINFSTCFVKQWFFGHFFLKKRGENPLFMGILLFARTKIIHFSPKSKSL